MSRRKAKEEYRVFADRLRAAITSSGVTQTQIAEDLNFSKSMMTNYVHALSMPESDRLYRIAEYLDVAPAWLFGADVNPDGTASDSLTVFGIRSVSTQRLPLLGNVACGEPIYASEDHEAMIEADGDIRADFALRCKGESMAGDGIHEGDIVFVRKMDVIPNGEIAVVLIDDEATIKRVHKSNGQITLLPSNSSYPPILINESEAKYVRILGRVVAFTHYIDKRKEES